MLKKNKEHQLERKNIVKYKGGEEKNGLPYEMRDNQEGER